MNDEPVFSVSEFLDLTNELLGQRDFTVQGEVVEAKDHPTGLYLTLKDPQEDAVMECYASPYVYRGLGIAVERGMVLRVGGMANVWKKRGRFSFRIETIELAGEGSLKKAYDALKKKLAAEGLFDRKRSLPEFISHIGLVTSRTGAVIDDFRNNLLPLGMRITHYDVRVEGAQAVPSIRRALEWFNAHAADTDILVLIRGGGSLEDLQAFNEELVVRAVFGMRMPTLVSIGHHRDMPLAQMASDAEASTPTATAHVVNQSWAKLTTDVPALAAKLAYNYSTVLDAANADVRTSAGRLAVHLARLAGRGRELEQRLQYGLGRIGDRISAVREEVASYARHLDASSPERLLHLGYSIVSDAAGSIIRSAGQLHTDQEVRTRLANGSFVSAVKDVSSTS